MPGPQGPELVREGKDPETEVKGKDRSSGSRGKHSQEGRSKLRKKTTSMGGGGKGEWGETSLGKGADQKKRKKTRVEIGQSNTNKVTELRRFREGKKSQAFQRATRKEH